MVFPFSEHSLHWASLEVFTLTLIVLVHHLLPESLLLHPHLLSAHAVFEHFLAMFEHFAKILSTDIDMSFAIFELGFVIDHGYAD